jgi:hypothetical protein
LPYRPLEPGARFSFELSGNRGAALVTRYPTYPEDAQSEPAFEAYTKRHYESWVKFARDKQYGDNLQPVLVTGLDMTRDFAMVAYSWEGTPPELGSTIVVPVLGSTPASVWGTWRTGGSPHITYGPQQRRPPPYKQTIDSPSSQSVGAGNASNESRQSVFIRYYTMRSRKEMEMAPKIIQFGVGPHDFNSGDDRGDAYLESTERSDAESTMNSDEDLGSLWGLVTDDDDDESNIVVSNTPFV